MAQQLSRVARGLEIGRARSRRMDHQAALQRLRRSIIIAIVAWPFFGLVDWYITEFVSPGRLWFHLMLRGIGLVGMLGTVLIVFGKKEPTAAQIRFIDAAMCSITTVLITISGLEYGGITSPLAMGVILVLLVRSVIFADHWKHGIVPVGLVVLLFPLTFLAMAGFSPYIAAQFSHGRSVATFFLNLIFVAGAGFIVLVGGHLIWTLKRQVYHSRSLGRYRLKRRIGVGGMGEVWLAHHHALRKDVAIKILKLDSSLDDERAIKRFEREVRATSELSHPNTVRVFDYGATDDGLWYYAMELLDGLDLHDFVSQEGPMNPLRAANMMAQAARALAEAHANGIVHRDIKPENIFLTQIAGQGDFVKILDFGLARLRMSEEQKDSTLTQAGWAVGTPQWVSPEVVMGDVADARSDIYGLGAVLYFLLCCQSPFGALDMRQVLRAHMEQTPKTPSERLGRPVPGGIESVVMRCLAKNPDERFQSAEELASALEHFIRVPECPEDVHTLDGLPPSTAAAPFVHGLGVAEGSTEADMAAETTPLPATVSEDHRRTSAQLDGQVPSWYEAPELDDSGEPATIADPMDIPTIPVP